MLRKFADIIGLPFSDDPEKSLALALERTSLGVEYDLKQFVKTKEMILTTEGLGNSHLCFKYLVYYRTRTHNESSHKL